MPSAPKFRLLAAALTGLACLLLMISAPAESIGGDDNLNVPAPNDRYAREIQDEVEVTSAVPSESETLKIFGFSLYSMDIQPVWVEVKNKGSEVLWFLPSGTDDAYYTPLETAYRLRNRAAGLDRDLNRDYYRLRMRMRVPPGGTRSGYIFTRVDQGTKAFNIDVIDNQAHHKMSFFIPVPGLNVDHHEVEWSQLYAPGEIQDVDRDGLVAALEALPCCVKNKDGDADGDPLNLVLIGDARDAYYAFLRAGWDETETISSTSLWKTLKSTIGGGEYRYSPVSALYVYDRHQDIALQKSRTSIKKRNHLRLWLSPLRYEGKSVWVGQISRDIGVRFTAKTITTHKIDPDVDETREYLLEDLAYAESVSGFGYVGGVGAAPFDSPRGNLTGDPYFTDGLRLVIFIASETRAIDEIEVVDLGQHPLYARPEP